MAPEVFIQRFLPVAPVRLVAPIRLHQAGPGSGLSRLIEQDGTLGSPYWAHVWSGGLALARFLLDHPEHVVGRGVLDLGTGSGLVAIAAALAGARTVIAADTDRYAVAAAGLNAALNGVAIETVLGDLTDQPVPEADVILVGDLFYDRTIADRVTAFLDRCTAAGRTVLIGDPGRAHLPATRLTRLAAYAVPDVGMGASASTTSTVFSFGAGACSDTLPLPHAEEARRAVSKHG